MEMLLANMDVNSSVHSVVGDKVGDPVGKEVGELDGPVVGREDGFTVSPGLDGDADGSTVGWPYAVQKAA